MLEHPKAPFPFYGKAKVDITMDNQQATCKWARLAGLLMGDGHFSMIPYNSAKTSRSGFTAVRPMIVLTNQDATLIELAAELYDEFGITYYIENRMGGCFGKRNPITNILVMRFDSVKLALENLIPWLVGDKKARAQFLLRYVSKERRGRRQYDPDDAEIIKGYLAVTKNRKGKPTRLAGVLRDYEQNSLSQADDIAQPAV
jgi:hypothetical protein